MTELRVVGGDLLPPPRGTSPPALDRRPDAATTSSACSRRPARSRSRRSATTRSCRPCAAGSILNVFYESSTRTSSSFELAAKRLSADTLTLKAAGSSVDKGESLKDTALTLSAYDPDVIVLRHPEVGAAQYVARVTEARVVNAGDGKHQHPTQALLDLYTMREAFGRLDGLQVAIVGDVAALARRAVARPGAAARRRRRDPRRPAGARCRPGLRRDVARHRRDRRRRRRSTSCACSRSACSRARTSSRRSREYTARWGITPERVRAGPARDAPRPDEPRRRDRRARRRLRRGADRRPGALRA